MRFAGAPLRTLPRRDPAQRRAVDGWVRIVPGVLGLHLVMLVTLWARPGHVALWIWYAGPIALVLATAVLLVASLRSAHRWKHGANIWHLLAYTVLVAVIVTLPVYDPYPSSHDAHPSGVAFRLPLAGPLTVAWGGSTSEVNYHVFLPDQRWAYDLLVTSDGRSFRTDGVGLDDYYAYGLPVYAPAPGVVFAAHDGEPEVKIGAPRWGLAGLGNHVGVEVAPGEYLFMGHLQPGSVAAGVGDRVTAGQMLGRVGKLGQQQRAARAPASAGFDASLLRGRHSVPLPRLSAGRPRHRARHARGRPARRPVPRRPHCSRGDDAGDGRRTRVTAVR